MQSFDHYVCRRNVRRPFGGWMRAMPLLRRSVSAKHCVGLDSNEGVHV